MATRFRLFTKRLLIVSNLLLVVFFLLSCLAPYLNPGRWWFFSFLGLAYPALLLLTLLFALLWILLARPRRALISGIALLPGIPGLLVFFAFRPPAAFAYPKPAEHLRVVTWNVARFVEIKKGNNKGSEKRKKMLELLKQQNADVLCLQEFHTSTREDFYDNISVIRDELGFPYHYFNYDTDGDQLFYSSIIFSRYPIVDSGTFRYPRPTLPDVLLHADIRFGPDTVRVFTTRLQSLRFNRLDYANLDKIRRAEDSLFDRSRNIVSKLRLGFSFHGIQAGLIRDILDVSPHPVIFCADLNDIPQSYTYRVIRGDMQDAFLKRGFGIGRTYNGLSPTLRIDYIFADRRFRVRQFTRVVKNLSDHFLLAADLELYKE